jgi:aromatic ring-opening dioxygenase catalytic subunit (LigB family)
MGQIVAAMATVHAPQLFTRPPEEDPAQLDASVAAMRELGKRLEDAKPDAVILFGSDHMETYFLQSVPTFSIVLGEHAEAKFAGRTWRPPIHQELGEALLEGLVNRDFDMTYSQDAILGHSFAAPFEWVLGGSNIPVVPVFVNTYLPPLPTARRCAALGKAIVEIVANRPERVALIASGGMSHYPGTSRYYRPAYDFDLWCIRELENGRAGSFLNLSSEQLDEVGNTEMLPWAPVLGAVGKQHMELLSYQATAHHGHAVVQFHPGEKPGVVQPFQPYQFHNEPFHFYNHPAISAYKLNKLLYDSRSRPQLRLRMLKDAKAVGAEYGLRPEEIEVLTTVCELKHNGTERPALDADPLVALGAHPIGALMAVHVLQAEQRRMRQATGPVALVAH